MRLIDAHDIEYEHICGEFRVSEEKINAMPTVCDIDAIRQEIGQKYNDCIMHDDYEEASGLEEALMIIDRHMKGDKE